VKPNADTYVQLMTACSKGGQTPAAVALMDEMQVKGIVPTAASAAAVMLALGNTRTRESATEGAQRSSAHTPFVFANLPYSLYLLVVGSSSRSSSCDSFASRCICI
jgi:pentatricopeptide repeat protein